MVKTFFRVVLLALLVIPVVGIVWGGVVVAARPDVYVLQVEGTIVPAVYNYINRGISEAEEQGSVVCIIELNTPGGLLGSTEEIVQRIMNAGVPVVVYVSPRGGWAASAGTFITLSAHIAAMAPGTTIGAAHPVGAGGEEIPPEQMEKITRFAAKWIETIATERGRNLTEASLAVTESKSFRSDEALEYNLIDLQSDSLESLISQINGREVTLAGGEVVTINTAGYEATRSEMNSVEHFLQVISDPNIAYLLLSLATIGLITEVSNPGMVFPGVAGGISLIMAFYSLGVLNAYWGGVFLILLALGLFIAELFVTSHGALTAGGLAALVIGSLILFSHTYSSPAMEVSRGLIAGVAAAVAGFLIFVIGAIIRGQRRRKATGAEGMIGEVAVARMPLNPTGTVLAKGELWTAATEGDKIEPGEEVVITRVEGLKLWVRRKLNKE
jgi:membrane-bound serine protease (ClpP class)